MSKSVLCEAEMQYRRSLFALCASLLFMSLFIYGYSFLSTHSSHGVCWSQSGVKIDFFKESKKPILFIYLTDHQKSGIEPWLMYWKRKDLFSHVLIVNYDGKSHLHSLENQPHQMVLEKFDSAPYGFYPMHAPPALYLLSSDWKVEGPFYRYDQVVDLLQKFTEDSQN